MGCSGSEESLQHGFENSDIYPWQFQQPSWHVFEIKVLEMKMPIGPIVKFHFLPLVKMGAELRKFSTGVSMQNANTDSCLLVQKWSKSVQNKWSKGCITSLTEKQTKHVFAPFGGTFGAIFAKILHVSDWVHITVPHLYSRFHPNLVTGQVLGRHNRKTSPWPPKVNAIQAFQAYN